MVASVPSVTQQLRVGQRVNVVFLDTTGPTDIFIRICSLEKAFQDFSATMVANYNDSPEIPYMCVLIIMCLSLTTVIPQKYHTCAY